MKFDNWVRNEKPLTEKALGLFQRPRKPSLREKLSSTIYRLETTSQRLKTLSEGLERRNQKVFEKCIEAEMAGNAARATMYANECAEIRKFASLVISSELALEQAALRLQTISKLGDVMTTVSPIIEIVEETKGRLGNIIPSVSSTLNEINDSLKENVSKMSLNGKQSSAQESGEAEEILREANLAAEQEVRDRFPQLPDDLDTQSESSEPESKTPVALAATGGEEERSVRGNREDRISKEVEALLTQRVYEYIKACNGDLNPTDCASTLGVPPRDIERAVLRLRDEGKVSLE